MLEVLLWQPFIVSADRRSKDSPKAISEHFQLRAIKLGEKEGIPERYYGDTDKMTSKPTVVRRVMEDLCCTELPACAGSKLAEVVMDCLRCLDNGGNEQRETADENLESGFRYIGDVLVALGGVSI